MAGHAEVGRRRGPAPTRPSRRRSPRPRDARTSTRARRPPRGPSAPGSARACRRAVSTSTPCSSMPDDARPRPHGDPELSSWRVAERDRSGRVVGRIRSSASTRTIRVAGGSIAPEVAASACRARSRRARRRAPRPSGRRRRPRTSSTRGARSGSPSRSAASNAIRIRRRIVERVLDRLEARAPPAPTRRGRSTRTGRRSRRRACRTRAGRRPTGRSRAARGRCPTASPSRTVVFAARRRIERSGWAISPGVERAGRDLVEQRLEQVEVAAVDERDLDRVLAAQRPGRVQPGEPAADDDDAVRPLRHSRRSLLVAFGGAAQRRLRGGQARHRHAVGRARHVVEPEPVAERDRRRVAAVLAADADLEVRARRPAPSRPRSASAGRRPSTSSVWNGLSGRMPRST